MSKESNKKSSKFFITKEEPNLRLWKKIQELEGGTYKDKVQAVALIFDNYTTVPNEADDLLKNMATPENPVRVRREIAKRLVAKPRIPWILHLKLLEILSKDKDKEVTDTIEPIWKSYRQIYESLVPNIQKLAQSYSQALSSMIPKDYFENIIKQLQITIIPEKTIANLKERIAALYPSTILSLREQMKNVHLQQLPKFYSDSLITLKHRQENLFRNAFQAVPSYSYYPVDEKIAEIEVAENPLISKLKDVPPGEEHWQDYQTICSEILTSCFVPPLSGPFEESRTLEGIHRRDIIFSIPAGISGFWGWVQNAFSAVAIIVDAKNYSRELPPDQIVDVSKYLGAKKLGNLGIIISRRGPSLSAKKQQIHNWIHYEQMIICLSDDDLKQMITLKETSNNPEIVLEKHIIELRKSI